MICPFVFDRYSFERLSDNPLFSWRKPVNLYLRILVFQRISNAIHSNKVCWVFGTEADQNLTETPPYLTVRSLPKVLVTETQILIQFTKAHTSTETPLELSKLNIYIIVGQKRFFYGIPSNKLLCRCFLMVVMLFFNRKFSIFFVTAHCVMWQDKCGSSLSQEPTAQYKFTAVSCHLMFQQN